MKRNNFRCVCRYCGRQYSVQMNECLGCGAKEFDVKLDTSEFEAKADIVASKSLSTVELLAYRITSVLCAVTFVGWICSPGMIIWMLIRQKYFKKPFDKFSIFWMFGCLVFCIFLVWFIKDTY